MFGRVYARVRARMYAYILVRFRARHVAHPYIVIPNNHLRLFASMVRSGITPSESLRSLGAQKYRRLIDGFEQGGKYSEVLKLSALARHGQYIELVVSAERSGAVPQVLEDIALMLEHRSSRMTQIIGIIVYPIVVMGITGALLIGVLYVVIPNIAPIIMSASTDISIVTKLMVLMSESIRMYMWMYIGLFVLCGGVLTITLKHPVMRARLERAILGIPIIGELYQHVSCVQYIMSLRTHIKYSTDIRLMFKRLAEHTSSLNYKQAFAEMAERVEAGKKLSEALTGYEVIPELWSVYARVGENSSNYIDMFEGLYQYYAESVESSLKLCMKIIEPVLMVSIGIVVGIVAFGILSPIYGLMNAFN
jgi:type II secretory pathway component PulF